MSIDWVAVGAIGSFTVAVIAWLAIRSGDKRTQKIIDLDKDKQRLKGKERVLTQIAEWVLDISTCSFVGIKTIPKMTQVDLDNIFVEYKQNKVLRYAGLVIKGTLLSSLAQNSNLDKSVLVQLTEVNKSLNNLWYVLNIKSGFDLPDETFLGLRDERKQYIEELKALDTNKLEIEYVSVSRDLALATLKLQSLVSKSISTLYS